MLYRSTAFCERWMVTANVSISIPSEAGFLTRLFSPLLVPEMWKRSYCWNPLNLMFVTCKVS